MLASRAAAVPFVVLKGYHMGSKWFEEAFNQVRGGGAFYFEYEHCLKAIGRDMEGGIAPPAVTLNYLHHGCGCSRSCIGCNRTVLSEYVDQRNSTSMAALHRLQRATTMSRERSSHGSALPARCRAAGVSFGAMGPQWMSHYRNVLMLDPRVRVVVHVRSNHVKHALSFLRTGCEGELNHATKNDLMHRHESLLSVPPALLLLKACNVAREQAKLLKDAHELARGHLAHIMRYEDMQRGLDGELERLLHAIGAAGDGVAWSRDLPEVPPAAASPTSKSDASTNMSLVKAGSDDLRHVLRNWDEVDAYLRPWPCLHQMLVARGPVAFEMHACEAEVQRLLDASHRHAHTNHSFDATARQDMDAERIRRPRLVLNVSECSGRTVGVRPAGINRY